MPTSERFFKMLIRARDKIIEAPPAVLKGFVLLSFRMDKTNRVNLSGAKRKLFAEELGVSMQRLTPLLKEMVEKGLLVRTDRGEYMVNPNVFSKTGGWQASALLEEWGQLTSEIIELRVASNE
jgi:hypothetical protein